MLKESTSIHSLWDLATRVKEFHFEAVSSGESKTGWNGAGEGIVEIQQPREGECHFLEQGLFRMTKGPNVAFKNHYVWYLYPGAIDVYHFRQETPQFLVHLVSKSATGFHCEKAHQCGPDTYSLQVNLTHKGFSAIWIIRGEQKKEDLFYHYYG